MPVLTSTKKGMVRRGGMPRSSMVPSAKSAKGQPPMTRTGGMDRFSRSKSMPRSMIKGMLK